MIWLKVAYLGWAFHGSQIQPNAKTVEGELLRALSELGWLEKRIGFASRTDAGVSALENIFAYHGTFEAFWKINKKLSNIAVWGFAEAKTNPRRAKLRVYRYFLPKNYSIDGIKEFEGTHDFRAFSKARRGTVRTIEKIDVKDLGIVWAIDFYAKSFLWNQIRRIIGFVTGLGLAPPENLILLKVEPEEEVYWHEEKKWLKMMVKDWEKELAKSLVMYEIWGKSFNKLNSVK